MPQIITGRRPMASDSGPCTSEAKANGTMYAVSTCCSASASTCSAFSMAWKAGKKVSMENGLTIDSPPSSTASIAYPGSLCCKELGGAGGAQGTQELPGILSVFHHFHKRRTDDHAGDVAAQLLHLLPRAD